MNFGNESIIKFLNSLTILKNMWSIVSPILYEPSLYIGLKFAIYLGILIVPTAIVSGLVTLIVWIVYNPNTKKEESGNKEADSLTLYEMSKELSARADSQKGIFSGILIVAYIFEALCIGVLYGMFLLKENNGLVVALNAVFQNLFLCTFHQHNKHMIVYFFCCLWNHPR